MSDSETLFVQLAVQRGITTQSVAQECMNARPHAGGRTLPQLLVERANIPQELARQLYSEAQQMAQRQHAPDINGFISDTAHGANATQAPPGPYQSQGPQGTRNDATSARHVANPNHTPSGFHRGETPSSSGWGKNAPIPAGQGETPISPGALQPGFVFNRYRLESELGRGGMGVVWKARQVDLDRNVAIKMLLQGALATPKHRQRFTAEAKAVARLLHPNLVTVHDVGEEGGILFFTMDLVDGPSLSRFLKTTPVGLKQALEIGAGIAEGLDHAHKQGIVHRDLKPANVLIDPRGAPRITDFGIAKDTKNIGMTAPGEVLGTPAYMAPEQARGGASQVDGRADVYSLGAILYRMIAGQPPFSGESSYDVIQKVINSTPVPLRKQKKDVPPEVDRIVMKCLAGRKEERYASAAEAARELRRVLLSFESDQPPVVVQSSKTLWIGGAIGALIVVLVAAILGIQYRKNVELSQQLEREAAARAAKAEADERDRNIRNAQDDVRRAKSLMESDPRAALGAAQSAAKVLSGDAEVLALLGRLLLDAGNDAKAALEVLDRAVGIAPKHLEALRVRGQCLLALDRGDRDVEGVARQLEKIGTPAGRAAAAELRCALALSRDELSVAVVHLDQAVRSLPKDSRLRLRMVELLIRARRFASAEEEAKEAIGLAPRSADAYALRAKARLELDRARAAADDVKAALAIDPEHALARELEAKVKAATPATPASHHPPVGEAASATGHPKTHALLGAAAKFIGQGRVNEARQQIDACFKNEPAPSCEKALKQRLQYCLVLRLTPFALRDAETLRTLKPSDPSVLELIASVYMSAGRLGEAADVLTRVVELDPTRPTAYGLRASVYEQQGEDAKALEALGEAIQRRPHHEFFHKRAHLLTKLSRHDESLADVEKAIELSPDNGHYFGMKGKSLVALERNDEARAAFEAVLVARKSPTKDKDEARAAIRKLGGQ